MLAPDYEAFALALRNATAPVPIGLRCMADAVLAERFAVYRNNVHVNLVDALGASFPVTKALVGDDFFHAMARSYVQERKPSSEQLHEYGRDLPKFIAGFAPANELPWLADVATLEATWSDSWAAADTPPLLVTSLAAIPVSDLPELRMRAHPAARLVNSPWPIGSIWQAHQAETVDLGDIRWQAECVLVTRPHAVVELLLLPSGCAEFAHALLRDHLTVADAADFALRASPQLDVGSALGVLIESGAIEEIIKS